MKTVTACMENDKTPIMGEVRRWFCAEMIINLELMFTIILKFFRRVSFFCSRVYDNCVCVCVVVSLDMIQTWNLLQF